MYRLYIRIIVFTACRKSELWTNPLEPLMNSAESGFCAAFMFISFWYAKKGQNVWNDSTVSHMNPGMCVCERERDEKYSWAGINAITFVFCSSNCWCKLSVKRFTVCETLNVKEHEWGHIWSFKSEGIEEHKTYRKSAFELGKLYKPCYFWTFTLFWKISGNYNTIIFTIFKWFSRFCVKGKKRSSHSVLKQQNQTNPWREKKAVSSGKRLNDKSKASSSCFFLPAFFLEMFSPVPRASSICLERIKRKVQAKNWRREKSDRKIGQMKTTDTHN